MNTPRPRYPVAGVRAWSESKGSGEERTVIVEITLQVTPFITSKMELEFDPRPGRQAGYDLQVVAQQALHGSAFGGPISEK